MQNKVLKRLERKRKRKKKKKPKDTKKGQKLSNRQGVCAKILRAFRRNKGLPSKRRPSLILHKIFNAVIVSQSVEKGILPQEIHVAVDGSPFETTSNSYGTRECECRKKGIYRCDCPHRYSDPYANWGWDSSRNRYFYGRNLYTLTYVNGKYELPVYVRFGQGIRHDAPLSMFATAESIELFHQLNAKVTIWVGDSAHDSYAIYSLLVDDYNIVPKPTKTIKTGSSLL